MATWFSFEGTDQVDLTLVNWGHPALPPLTFEDLWYPLNTGSYECGYLRPLVTGFLFQPTFSLFSLCNNGKAPSYTNDNLYEYPKKDEQSPGSPILLKLV
ncbi:hypothetical protein HO173_001468 [Letharia columbiana]|uniref:Uncharacterized protein n=1 Tax=Letharia columbiana TaxID=112416 RepID=A0A8H6G5G7_9LECA|nr:uncharacterized protein HO173_001468 [Letharia columbiana]KAF6240795.1 hypothetical protein HO173_001468 [Letharia columbiana]